MVPYVFSVALDPGEQVIPLSDGKTTSVKIVVSSQSHRSTYGKTAIKGSRRLAGRTRQLLMLCCPKEGDKQDFLLQDLFPGS